VRGPSPRIDVGHTGRTESRAGCVVGSVDSDPVLGTGHFTESRSKICEVMGLSDLGDRVTAHTEASNDTLYP
jgi:hypothetical protein